MAKKKGDYSFQFTDDILKQIEDMAAIGLSQQEIATILGINRLTVQRRQKDDPRIKEAWNSGRLKGKRSNMLQLHKLTASDKTNESVKLSAIKYSNNIIHSIIERQRVEHTGEDGSSIKVDNNYDLSKLSVQELKATKAMLLKAQENKQENNAAD